MTTLTMDRPTAPAVQVPGWVAPVARHDALFPVLATLGRDEVAVAVLASGRVLRRHEPSFLTLDQAAEMALEGLRRIGVAEAKYVAAQLHAIDGRFLAEHYAIPGARARGYGRLAPERYRAWDRELSAVRGGWLSSRTRMDRAIAVATYLLFDGIGHDDPSAMRTESGRCLSPGYCRHCYPENFTAAEVA
jgi:hypothetical protein